MSNKKHIIFSNMEQFSNCSEACEDNGYCESDCDYIVLNDERMNLNKKVPGRILAIADLGLWNGRVSGYKVLGDNIKDILYSDSDYIEWYSDGRNIKGTFSHHDGTNYIEYRVIRENRKIENLLKKIYNNEEISRQTINYYTESLHPYIAKIYGW